MGHSRLNRIRNWEELASKAKYKLNDLANLAATSPRHLRRYIESSKGKTPHKWMIELRLKSFADLRDQGKSIKEIASIAKFKQASHFSRVFKEFTGHPPSSFGD